MDKIVKIENLKSIKKIEFKLPERSGVYLLTGANGVGKSALLGALYRIGCSNAFQKSFFTCKSKKNIDSFAKGKITYSVGENSVSYRHSQERWAPTPKKNSTVLQDFGYSSVSFFAVDERRIVPSKNEFEARSLRWRDVDQKIKDGIKEIFDNSKYENLKFCKSLKGNAFSIPIGSNFRYTEKNFSSGEINILRLLSGLHSLNNKALILIDEVEMSLHPKAQLRLLSYLKEYAEEKESTIIFSSHSETLIKKFSYSNIILMYQEGAESKIQVGCFPESALERISDRNAISLDYLVLVEDSKALSLSNFLLDKYLKLDNAKNPRVKILAGVKGRMGYSDLIELAAKLTTSFPNTKIKPLLDKDAEEYIKIPEIMNPTGDNNTLRENLEIIDRCVTYLPVTPEQGLIEWLLNSGAENYKKIGRSFYRHIDWSSLILSDERMREIQAGAVDWQSLSEDEVKRVQRLEASKRDKSKQILERVKTKIKEQEVGYSDDLIDDDLFRAYVEHCDLYNEAFLRTLFGRLFS